MPKMPTKKSSVRFDRASHNKLHLPLSSGSAAQIAHLYQVGNLSSCKDAAQVFLLTHPKNFSILMILGAACTALQDYKGAQDAFKKAHQINPGDSNALNNLGTAQYNLGLFQESVKSYKAAHTLGKNDANFLINYSNALKAAHEKHAAVEILRQAANRYRDNVRVWIAICYCQIDIGELEDARFSAEKAVSLAPQLAKSHAAMGAAFFNLGQLESANQSYSKAVTMPDATFKDYFSLGTALAEMKRYDSALDATEIALSKNPRDEKSLINAAWICLKLGRHKDSSAYYSKALTVNPKNAEAFAGLAAIYYAEGDYLKSVEFFRYSLNYRPDDMKATFGLARALIKIGKESDALNIFKQNLEKIVSDDDWYQYAVCLEHAQRIDESIKVYEQLKERNYKPLRIAERLFNAFELRSQLSKAKEALEPLHGSSEHANILRLFEGILHSRKREYDLALEKLETVRADTLSASSQVRLYATLGEVLDKLKKPDEAMSSFESMNAISSQIDADIVTESHEFLQKVKSSALYYMANPLPAPSRLSKLEGQPQIGFIVGYPRSGTTLLDTVLRTHSKVSVIEERPMLSHAIDTVYPNGFESNDLDTGKIALCRERYLSNLKFEMSEEMKNSSLVFDKLPLHLLELPLIHAMFPDAPIIFAARHPFDAILSNYMQNFKLNKAMACMLKLQTAAELYCAAMQTLEGALKNADVKISLYRYESIVNNFGEEVKQLLSSVDLKWEASLTDYRATALARNKINTPSYRQVTQPIYKESAYRWERYSKYLSPHKEVIQPYIDKLGYNPNYKGPLYKFVKSKVQT
ncbi:tetratricopeptide repeat-containing sulfotransferase family protein [Tropicibacter alexandrii]|uniref:tetratricopeptide repeat-containing sulfotransferase family protein n=1 Tax=Tropicibacter alexandrii TaxID=2267683 RepID=UPI000EF4F88B|nr:tetratricopeptide repeat-containing sulfotransferase family protein [Tropicibacter alexandrii]